MAKNARSKTSSPSPTNTAKTIDYKKVVLGIYIFVLAATFFVSYHHTLDKKMAQLGDNASYFILGRSLALGQGYVNIHTKERKPHRHYPPGYPFIISLASKLSLATPAGLKKINGFFFLMSIGLLFLVIYQLTDSSHLAFITSLFMLLNYHLLIFASAIMTEIPFLFFSMLCLWLAMQINFKQALKNNWPFFALIICIAIAYYIRTSGLALFAGFVLWLLWQRKWLHLGVLSSSFLVLILPWYIRNNNLGGNTYLKQLVLKNPYSPDLGQLSALNWLERIWQNSARYITREIPSGIYNFINTNIDYTSSIRWDEWLIGIITLVIIALGVFKILKTSKLIIFYVISTLGILLLWPPIWAGVRFLLPIIPLLFFLFSIGIMTIIGWVLEKYFNVQKTQTTAIVFVVLGILLIKSYATQPIIHLAKKAKNTYPKKYINYFALAEWAKTNTPDTSVISCRKEKLFFLFSNRWVSNFKNTANEEKQIEYLKSKSVDYIIIDALGYNSTQKYLVPVLKKYPGKFKIMQATSKPQTYILRFLPHLGYSGEWKNKKKEGKGIYKWGDGKKYIGQWTNNQRNGQGVLYLPDGQQLEGIWTDDKLSGEVIVRNKNTNTIEKKQYKDNKEIANTPNK